MSIVLHTRFKKLLADTHTPVGLYLKLRDRFPGSILLESSDYHGHENSRSFICCEPIASFRLEDEHIYREYPGGESVRQPLLEAGPLPAALQGFIDEFSVEQPDVPFPCNGLFGFTTFDAVQRFEDIRLEGRQAEAKKIPELYYALYRFVIVFDHFKDELFLFEHTPGDLGGSVDLEALERYVEQRGLPRFRFQLGEDGETSNLTDEQYKAMVRRGKAECQRGNVFQVVLSREFSRGFRGDEFNVYRALRSVNPSPYLFYFDYGSFKLFGSSPEAQLVLEKGVARIHPIAGTMRRSGDDEQDQRLALQLSADRKEKAEHVMLVDLARNDLSRHCTEVQVEVFAEVQYYSHVIHLVSRVTGRLEGSPPLQVFADTFPAGTLSGAPKHRALQIIDQCENDRRGYYGGCIGYIGFNGDFNHAIIIRSFLSKHNRLYYRAGAGIVVQSSEAGELQEVNNKLAALKKAIELAQTL